MLCYFYDFCYCFYWLINFIVCVGGVICVDVYMGFDGCFKGLGIVVFESFDDVWNVI